jgi:hypothetical protein
MLDNSNSRRNRTRLLAFAILAILLSALNYVGMRGLLGTGPTDALAVPFVMSVGAFWTQTQVLGFFAAFLPYPLYVRLMLPFVAMLFLCSVTLCYEKQHYIGGTAFILMLGFLLSWGCFAIAQIVFGLRLRRIEAGPELSDEAHASFGILDVMIVTVVVAVALALHPLDLRTSSGFVILSALAIYSALMILYAPMNLMLLGKRRIAVSLALMLGVLVGLPMLLTVSFQYFISNSALNTGNWPFLFCLTFGAQATWFVGLWCVKHFGFELASNRRRLDKELSPNGAETIAAESIDGSSNGEVLAT